MLIASEHAMSPMGDEADDDGGLGHGRQLGTAVITKPETRLREPFMYQVLLHNDDFTPMDFVVQVLENIFHLESTKAQMIMLEVHQKGIGCCGLYPYEIAETKVALVLNAAKEHEYPLKCTMEKGT